MSSAPAPRDSELEAIRTELGERIVRFRSQAQMTQGAAADRAGLNIRDWRRLESGGSFPRLDSLLRVQHALGLATVEALLGQLPSQAWRKSRK